MTEWRLFDEGTVPECTTPAWYEGRERAPHLEQPGHRERLYATYDHFKALLQQFPMIESVSDLGCGDGGFLSLLPSGLDTWGYDVSPEAVRGARQRGVKATQFDVISGEPVLGTLSVCTEMLEHLIDPHGFLQRVAWGSPFIIASSPATETDRDHYEFHTWAWDADGYRALLEGAGYTVTSATRVQSFQVLTGVKAAAE